MSQPQFARVEALMHHNARIGAQRPGELAASNIHRVNAGRTGLQQAVREAARRRTNVKADLARDVDRKAAKGGSELEAAAADVWRPRPHLDLSIVGDALSGLGRLLPVEDHFTRHNERLRFLARFGQAAVHQQAVEAHLHDLRWTMRSASSWRPAERDPKGSSTRWARRHCSSAIRREVARP